MTADKEFQLTPNELRTSTWRKLKEHLDARLVALRVKNEDDLDPVKTARVRGEIKVIKDLLALDASSDPAMVADDDAPE